MTLKEQQSQLKLTSMLYIVITIMLWLGVTVFISYKLWSLRKVPELPITQVPVSVPNLKEKNLTTLRSSVKLQTSSGPASISAKPEPFD